MTKNTEIGPIKRLSLVLATSALVFLALGRVAYAFLGSDTEAPTAINPLALQVGAASGALAAIIFYWPNIRRFLCSHARGRSTDEGE